MTLLTDSVTPEVLRVIEIFLNNEVNVKNFYAYARLNNIKSHKLLEEVLYKLATYRLSVADIQGIRVVNDESIREFLDVEEKRFSPQASKLIGGDNAMNAYEFLLESGETKRPLYTLLGRHNLLRNKEAEQEVAHASYLPSTTPVPFGTSAGARYGSFSDYAAAFKSRVLPKLERKLLVSNIESAIPSGSRDSNFRGNSESTLVRKINSLWEKTLGEARKGLADHRVVEFFGAFEDRPTFVSTNTRLITNLLNLDPYRSPLIPKAIQTMINELSLIDRGAEAKARAIAYLKSELETYYSYEPSLMNLNEYLCAMIIANAIERTLVEHGVENRNYVDISPLVEEYISEVHKFSDLFKSAEQLIVVNM